MSQLVTIYGGSGFIGRYIARRMAKQGWRVRVAVRRPNEAGFVRTYGVVGQVEPVLCNIRDDASVEAALAGADAVVNCVGILAEGGKNTFDDVQAEGAGRVARLAQIQGITRMVQLSAIGADAAAESDYSQTKARGEDLVLQHMPDTVILRPSVVFGPEDQFFNRFAGMAQLGPVLPVVGADTRFQPVYVDDVAQAAEKAVLGEVAPGIYELGGPDIHTFRELMDLMLSVIRRRRLVANIPFPIARMMGFGFDMAAKVTGGLITPALTRDQIKNLATDNIVAPGAKGFADLGIAPMAMTAVLPDYLWRFRPSGQYADIKDSARNLKT
ncbi:complex I NDUFA9 subunit family protein [Actibacterium sp. 188UL27-1]|uniref:complex I NDUFA9 subunit family protein n=1 Tax=Actibacterium sp. 188UL27-1 TaxID=2786961 RepID=UPI00195706F3|nr:complex I NDUFA9 subunit family protein [Actibacterium sp. 188UL27-1]MBM7067181.1 complex I NDUFA9 subunit family protein [Actibacterium sp. 188UL27-1]